MSKNPYNARKDDWKSVVLQALSVVPVLNHAADVAKVHRQTIVQARKKDPEFDQACIDAMEAGIDYAEKEAFRRAVNGWAEPVIDRGRLMWQYRREVDEAGEEKLVPVLGPDGQPIPLTVNKHSDSLLQFVLKGRRREVYGDKQELTGANGGPVTVLDETAKVARLAALLATAQERKAEQD